MPGIPGPALPGISGLVDAAEAAYESSAHVLDAVLVGIHPLLF
jgi:hypothetical protein